MDTNTRKIQTHTHTHSHTHAYTHQGKMTESGKRAHWRYVLEMAVQGGCGVSEWVEGVSSLEFCVTRIHRPKRKCRF